jgi:hypothetical protein
MTRELKLQLDETRFQLNRWETLPHLKVIGSINGLDSETGKIMTNIVVHTDKPLMIGPGMKIVIVPE